MSRQVVIVGGGISGLATAYFLREEAAKTGVMLGCTLVERKSRLGGVVLSDSIDGCVLEAGPESFFTPKPQAVDLCERLGIADLLIGVNARLAKTYVFCGGRLRALPEGLTSVVPRKLTPFLATDLLTPWGKGRMLLDLFIPRKVDAEESLAGFVERRLGREALERIAEPLMAGIYAGDARQLSLQANFPQLAQLELEHRSLILGALASRRHAPADPRRQGPGKPTFMSLRGGIGVMVDALVDRLKEHTTMMTGRRAATLGTAPRDQRGGRYALGLEDGTVVRADAVVLASPAYASAEILAELSPRAASILGTIPYASAATVGLVYDRETFPIDLDATGFVVAPVERKKITACTWSSSKWPQQSRPDRILLRCYVGRAGDQEQLELPDDRLCRMVVDEVNSILGVSAEPVLTRVHRLWQALPQYNVGHSEKVAALKEVMDGLPGVFLTGAAFEGVGMSDCIRQGAMAAAKVVRFMAG